METKKLTCCDLMIGDWVEVNGKCIQVENVYKDMINYTPYIPYAQEEYFIEEKDITPIPLTAEILEENGIRNYSELPEYKVRTNEYEIWVIFDEPQNCVHVEKFDKGIQTIYHSKILFVHELQHALRLCGVYKEIVL